MKKLLLITTIMLLLSPFLSVKAVNQAIEDQIMENSGKAKLTTTQWREDIDFYVSQLEKNHANLYHSQSKIQFYQNVELLKQQLVGMTDNQILVALMKLTKSINDGHTSFPLWGNDVHKYPFKLISLSGKYYVAHTTHDHKGLLGAELTAINGQAISKIIDKMERIVPFSENPYSTAVRVAQYMTIAEVLDGLAIVGGDDNFEANLFDVQFSFEQSGVAFTKYFKAAKKVQFGAQLVLKHVVAKNKIDQVHDNLWFSSSRDNKSIYVKFEQYADVAAMDFFARKLLNHINDNQSKHLIIDLRNNYGGDFFAGLRLAQALVLADSLDWHSGIYVLTNHVTFSAAMSNAAQFKRLLNAKLVGEPTGARPKGYQDMGEFTLKHSKRVVTYSKRYYDFLGSDEHTVYPDIHIELNIENYLMNQDKQLEWVLKQIAWSQ